MVRFLCRLRSVFPADGPSDRLGESLALVFVRGSGRCGGSRNRDPESFVRVASCGGVGQYATLGRGCRPLGRGLICSRHPTRLFPGLSWNHPSRQVTLPQSGAILRVKRRMGSRHKAGNDSNGEDRVRGGEGRVRPADAWAGPVEAVSHPTRSFPGLSREPIRRRDHIALRKGHRCRKRCLGSASLGPDDAGAAPGPAPQVFIESKKSWFDFVWRSLSRRNSMASTTPIGLRMRRRT